MLFSLAILFNGKLTKETKTVKAIFDGYVSGVYSFTDSNNEDLSYEFDTINQEVLKSFDLTDKKFVGKVFNITYEVETEIDETQDEYETWTVIKLELVK